MDPGCVSTGVPQEQLFVVVGIESGGEDEIGALPTDATGTATLALTAEAEDAGSTAVFMAACVQGEGDSATLIFEYPTAVTVAAAAEPPAPPAPAAPVPAAAPATATPSFTG
jgi:hypothetical protein